jgi:hypothetical protein
VASALKLGLNNITQNAKRRVRRLGVDILIYLGEDLIPDVLFAGLVE